MTITPRGMAAWQEHVGRTETRHDILAVETVRRSDVTLGADPDVERAPPLLGHCAFFLDVVTDDGLDLDGHPSRSGLLPTVRLPNHMFPASAMRWLASLLRDAVVELRVASTGVRHRPGKSGDVKFVEVDRVLVQQGTEQVIQRKMTVCREAGGATAPVQPRMQPHEQAGAVVEQWTPGPVDLFCFSAVTLSAACIHYDLSYAQDRESYPRLVVHEPFTAPRLGGLTVWGHLPVVLRQYPFRVVAPLFAGQPIGVVAGRKPGPFAGRAVRRRDSDGRTSRTFSRGIGGTMAFHSLHSALPKPRLLIGYRRPGSANAVRVAAHWPQARG